MKTILLAIALSILAGCSSRPIGKMDTIHAISPVLEIQEQIEATSFSFYYPDKFDIGIFSEYKIGDAVLTNKNFMILKWREDAKEFVPKFKKSLIDLVRVDKKERALGIKYFAFKFNDFSFISVQVHPDDINKFDRGLRKYASHADFEY